MDDLLWLPGVGATKQVQGAVKCGVLRIAEGVNVQSWSILYNNVTGIFKSVITLSTMQSFTFGLSAGASPSGSANFNNTYVYNSDSFGVGLQGYAQNQ